MSTVVQPSNQFMNYHQNTLSVIWCIIADISVFFSLYKYTRYSYYIHAILGILMFIITIGLTFAILIPLGLNIGFGGLGVAYTIHAWLGLLIICFVGLQVILGVFSRIWQRQNMGSSKSVLKLKKIHQITGYILLTIAKVSLLIGWSQTNYTIFWIILALEIILIPTYVVRKRIFPKLTTKIVDEQIQKGQNIVSISDLSQVSVQNYVIFSNYVYNVQRLKYAHPGGHQIIKTMMGREIDRFIYGMYSSELLPQVHKHEHSFKSLELVGPPIAKLVISPIYQGSMPQIMNVEIKMKEIVSVDTQIYCIRLNPVDGNIFRFVGYTDVKQLGHYYSLTIDDQITRLYTSVQFIRNRNISLIKKIFPQIQFSETQYKIPATKIQNNNKQTSVQIMSIRQTLLSKIQNTKHVNHSDGIPLMMKKYDQGALTSKLFSQNWSGKLKLSAPKGEGLKFSTLQPGKIIIVCGGTGFFPFADLIDLLFKQKLVNQGHHLKEQILKYNPILKNKPFEGFNFLLLAAFNLPQDIHPISLYQISELCKDNHKFRAIFRIKKHQSLVSSKHPNINYVKNRFEKILVEEGKKQKITKIWICGPPILNSETAKTLIENGFSTNDFLFI